MNNVKLVVTLLLVTILSSCKTDKKQTETPQEKVETLTFTVNPEATTVKWTAFKTTDKIPVSGTFNTINFEKQSGETIVKAFNNLEFSIPVSSIFSNNEERDGKLKTSFFGAMLNTELLKGKISFDTNGNCNATITMNDITNNLPLNYIVNKNSVTFKTLLDLEDWKALEALESLNKVCFDLHKGKDGISKTWNDVSIEITTKF